MKDEYIRREDAVNIAESYEVKIDGFCLDDYEYGRDQVAHSIANDLEDIAAADVAPVVHGKWIPHREKSREYIGTVLVHVRYDYWLCDTCGYRVENGQPMYNFCPNCGADMRGEQDDR